MRKRPRLYICMILLAAFLLCACGKENKTENSGTPAPIGTTSPTVTPTPTPTPTPTQTPTSTPTPTPTVSLGELVTKNRELHETLNLKTEISSLGTGPDYEKDKKAAEYGIKFLYDFTTTGKVYVNRDIAYRDNKLFVVLSVSGIRNEEAGEKINKRLKDVIMTISDPSFLPDAPGFLLLVKEKGLPVFSWEHEYTSYQGILSVQITGEWSLGGKKTVETFCLNFDMGTGEELSLSDLFPEGFDYIGYLNRFGLYSYGFWYKERNDGTIWELVEDYDPLKEYDGGRKAIDLKGDEAFKLDRWSGLVSVKSDDKWIELWQIPNIPRKGGEKAEYTVSSLDELYLGEFLGFNPFSFEGAYKTIGSFTICPNGVDDVSVTVCIGNRYDDSALTGSWNKYFTKEKILSYAEQWTSQWDGSSLIYNDIYLLLSSIYVYPKEYFSPLWYVYGKASNDQYYEVVGLSGLKLLNGIYIRDGKVLSLDEMFDIPFEEVLADLIASMRSAEGEYIATGEDAVKAAKALRPYVVEVTETDLHQWLFRWETGGQLRRGCPFGKESETLTDLKEMLPDELWKMLTDPDYKVDVSDPFVILKHMKMYEGCPFD